MLSRIADSLFWLNRYMERSDGLLRLTYVNYILSLDKDAIGNISWKPVLEMFTLSKSEEIATLEQDTEAALKKILVDTSNHNSLKTIIHKARENARGVQDLITKEVWEEVNQMYHLVNQPSLVHKLDAHQGLEIIDMFKKHSVIYTGITDTTMSRGMGWQFMNLGKHIERCLQTTVLFQKHLKHVAPFDSNVNDIFKWRYLLLSLSGYELHLKTYRSSNTNKNILHQILLNQNFTRSVIYSLNHIHFYLSRITINSDDEETAKLLRNFGRLHSKVKFLDLKDLNEDTLLPFLKEIEQDLLVFSGMLGKHFFSYS